MTLFIRYIDGSEDTLEDLTRAQAFQLINNFGASVVYWRLVGQDGSTVSEME